ncbi:MAG: MFS transporter [Acetobacteraceae bacterium]|nr:MFS transporter [Acetobacteraceae bacterium]
MINTRRLTLGLGFTQTLAWATTYYIPATMSGPASVDLGVSRAMLVGGFSAGLLVCGAASPLVGRWIETRGGRDVLIAAPLVTALGLGGLAITPGVVGWYLAWAITGIGMALGLYDAAFGTIGRLLGTAARPSIVGVTMMAGFASTVGWPSGTYLVAAVGWRWTLAVFALVQLLAILPVVLACVPRIGQAPEVTASTRRVAACLPEPPPHAFFWLASYFTVRSALNSAVFVHLLVLMQGLGFTLAASVAAAAMIGPAQVGARVIDWYFGRNLSPMQAAIYGASVLPISVLALLLGFPAPIFAIGFGGSNGVFTISRGTLPLYLFGPSGYAERIGMLARPAMIASAVAPAAFAPIVATLPAIWVVAIMGGLGVVAFGCLWMLRR